MCMSCGCGKVHERHKPGDIVREDLQRAAHNHDLTVEQVAQNIQRSAGSEGVGAGSGSGQSGSATTRGTAAEGQGVSARETPNM